MTFFGLFHVGMTTGPLSMSGLISQRTVRAGRAAGRSFIRPADADLGRFEWVAGRRAGRRDGERLTLAAVEQSAADCTPDFLPNSCDRNRNLPLPAGDAVGDWVRGALAGAVCVPVADGEVGLSSSWWWCWWMSSELCQLRDLIAVRWRARWCRWCRVRASATSCAKDTNWIQIYMSQIQE